MAASGAESVALNPPPGRVHHGVGAGYARNRREPASVTGCRHPAAVSSSSVGISEHRDPRAGRRCGRGGHRDLRARASQQREKWDLQGSAMRPIAVDPSLSAWRRVRRSAWPGSVRVVDGEAARSGGRGRGARRPGVQPGPGDLRGDRPHARGHQADGGGVLRHRRGRADAGAARPADRAGAMDLRRPRGHASSPPGRRTGTPTRSTRSGCPRARPTTSRPSRSPSRRAAPPRRSARPRSRCRSGAPTWAR